MDTIVGLGEEQFLLRGLDLVFLVRKGRHVAILNGLGAQGA